MSLYALIDPEIHYPTEKLFACSKPYSGKVWWEESLANLANHLCFAELKSSNLVLTINNLLAYLLIRQTFFRQMLKKSQFAKLSVHYTFPLYGTLCPTVWLDVENGFGIENGFFIGD